jgi:hypothetical protein
MLLHCCLVCARAAVASAYEPIADSRIPSPKSPIKLDPAAQSSRKLLQDAATTQATYRTQRKSKPDVMWGGFLVTPPTTRKLMQQDAAKTVAGNSLTNTNNAEVLWSGYVVTTPYW